MPHLNVLLVDDDSEESYLFNEALEHAHLHINLSRATDGNDLMAYLGNRPTPDLVFMDINMPYKDGLEALNEIRVNPKFKNLPLIIYSTTKNEDRINACYEKGADMFVIKPDDFDELMQVVKKICTYDWKNYTRPPRENFVITAE
jgi:CheY-like chemotaxis protein